VDTLHAALEGAAGYEFGGLLSFGVSLHGKGQVWLEGIRLEVREDQPLEAAI
jgi:hypothetical protein